VTHDAALGPANYTPLPPPSNAPVDTSPPPAEFWKQGQAACPEGATFAPSEPPYFQAACTSDGKIDGPIATFDAEGHLLALERYVTVDRSLATILDVFRPTLTDRDFYTELRNAGDVTDNRSLQAVPLRVVPELHGDPAYRPHVFVIVVDSLRPDYLAPYNAAAAAFTPSIAAFARESRVVQHAFTPYAGTALSQPGIWAGGGSVRSADKMT
jgi:hypothetical protein